MASPRITPLPLLPHQPRRSAGAQAVTVLVALLAGLACPLAQAHVKWFSRDADCAMAPLSLQQVLSNVDFLWLGLISFLVLVWATMVDIALSYRLRSLRRLVVSVDRRTVPVAATVLRWGLAAFFVIALWYFDGHAVYLTPELHTTAAWVAPLQVFTAVTLLWRRTAWLGALAIGVLYAGAGMAYGWFHMMDYPVFLGAALCIALDSFGHPPARGLAWLRASAGITLMWAAGEKWLYPWWSYGVLDHELHAFKGLMSSSAFMAAAGWIEFCAAFALVYGRLGVQVAAWVLLVPFLAAIAAFGPLDAVGHAPIIIVLVVLGLTRSRLPRIAQRQRPLDTATCCTLAALATSGAYWLLQALAYGSTAPTETYSIAVLSTLPLFAWLAGSRARVAVRHRPAARAQRKPRPGPRTAAFRT